MTSSPLSPDAAAAVAHIVASADRASVDGSKSIAHLLVENQRAARLVEGQNQALEAIVRGQPLPVVLEHLVRVVENGGDAVASILLVDAEAHCLRQGAAPALPADYNRAIDGVPISPDIGTCARAAAVNEVVITPDIASDRGWQKFKHLPLGLGLRAAWSMPIVSSQGEVLGTFGTYFRECRMPTPQEREIVGVLSKTAALAIERQRATEGLELLVAERTASLRAAVSQMEEFSYSVSHDLRAPVRAMRGFAEVLRDDHGAQLPPDGRQLLDRIIRNSAKMDQLIQDILVYSRLTRQTMQLESVALDPLITDIILESPTLHNEHVGIEIIGPLPRVIAHQPSLSQVISNLLNNAVKFVAPGTRPHVRLWTERQSNDVRVLIKDNGIGIKPEHHSRLFAMFERVHTQAYEGTGIGLAIVRKAMERMNGSAGVISDGVNGSTFWIQLPLA